MSGDYWEEVRSICGDGGCGGDGAKGDGGTDDSGCDGDGNKIDEQRGVDGHLATAELAEETAEREHVITGDGIGDALGGHEAAGRRAGGVNPQ